MNLDVHRVRSIQLEKIDEHLTPSTGCDPFRCRRLRVVNEDGAELVVVMYTGKDPSEECLLTDAEKAAQRGAVEAAQADEAAKLVIAQEFIDGMAQPVPTEADGPF